MEKETIYKKIWKNKWKYFCVFSFLAPIIILILYLYIDISTNLKLFTIDKLSLSLESFTKDGRRNDGSLNILANTKLSSLSTALMIDSVDNIECSLNAFMDVNTSQTTKYQIFDIQLFFRNTDMVIFSNGNIYNTNFVLLRQLAYFIESELGLQIPISAISFDCDISISIANVFPTYHVTISEEVDIRGTKFTNSYGDVIKAPSGSSTKIKSFASSINSIINAVIGTIFLFRVIEVNSNTVIVSFDHTFKQTNNLPIPEIDIFVPQIDYTLHLVDLYLNSTPVFPSSLYFSTTPMDIVILNSQPKIDINFNFTLGCSDSNSNGGDCSIITSSNIEYFLNKFWFDRYVNISLISNGNNFITSWIGETHQIFSLPHISTANISNLSYESYLLPPVNRSNFQYDSRNYRHASSCIYLNIDNIYLSSSCLVIKDQHASGLLEVFNHFGEMGQIEFMTRWDKQNNKTFDLSFNGQYQGYVYILGNASISSDFKMYYGSLLYNDTSSREFLSESFVVNQNFHPTSGYATLESLTGTISLDGYRSLKYYNTTGYLRYGYKQFTAFMIINEVNSHPSNVFFQVVTDGFFNGNLSHVFHIGFHRAILKYADEIIISSGNGIASIHLAHLGLQYIDYHVNLNIDKLSLTPCVSHANLTWIGLNPGININLKALVDVPSILNINSSGIFNYRNHIFNIHFIDTGDTHTKLQSNGMISGGSLFDFNFGINSMMIEILDSVFAAGNFQASILNKDDIIAIGYNLNIFNGIITMNSDLSVVIRSKAKNQQYFQTGAYNNIITSFTFNSPIVNSIPQTKYSKFNITSIPTPNPTLIPIYSGSKLLSFGNQTNAISYNGYIYSTLGDISITSFNSTCQDYYISIPNGWQLAPDTSDARLMISSYPWSTQMIILSNNISISTKNYPPSGIVYSQSFVNEANAFMTSWCNAQILIRYITSKETQIPTMQATPGLIYPGSKFISYMGQVNSIKYKGEIYSTLLDVPIRSQDRHICQYYDIQIPLGWEIAQDTSDARLMIASYYWSTPGVLLESGYSISTFGSNNVDNTICRYILYTYNGVTFASPNCDYCNQILIKVKKNNETYVPTSLPTSLPTYQGISFISYGGQQNAISYNGKVYSTISDILITSTDRTCGGCYSIPSGWRIASDTSDARYLVSLYPWSGDFVLLADNLAIYTSISSSRGEVDRDRFYRQSDQYCTKNCGQILIEFGSNIPTYQPTSSLGLNVTFLSTHNRTNCVKYNGNMYSTLADVQIQTYGDSHQYNSIMLPYGWEVASDNEDTRLIISSFYWSTRYVVLSDRIAIGTRDNNNDDNDADNGVSILSDSNGYYIHDCCRFQILIILKSLTSKTIPNGMRLLSFQSQNNSVLYNGEIYSTLQDVSITSKLYSCQNSWYSIPSGWELAPDNPKSRFVISSFPWSSEALLLANNIGILTSNALSASGGVIYHTWIQDKSSYSVSTCSDQILIKYRNQTDTLSPSVSLTYFPVIGGTFLLSSHDRVNCLSYKGQIYSTLSDVSITTKGRQCQNFFTALPFGWKLVNDSLDARYIISSYYWSTDMVVLNNSIAIATKSNIGELIPNILNVQGSMYSVSGCNAEILIQFIPNATHSPSSLPSTYSPSVFPTTFPLYPGSALLSYKGQSNSLSYNGEIYSTLCNVAITSFSRYSCSYYISLPIGWELAPDTPDARLIAASYPWSSNAVVLKDNVGIGTYQSNSGTIYNCPFDNSGNQYYLRYYSCRINSYSDIYSSQLLIKYHKANETNIPSPKPSFNPTNSPVNLAVLSFKNRNNCVNISGEIYSTLSDSYVYSSYYCHSDQYTQIPAGWELAPNSSDARFVASNYPWGSQTLILQNNVYLSTSVNHGNNCRDENYDPNFGYLTYCWYNDFLIKYRDPSESYSPTIYSTNIPNAELISYRGKTHALNYKGVIYSTIQDFPINSTNVMYYNYYELCVPDGWEIAHDSPDVRFVIQSYAWSSNYVVVFDGNGLPTGINMNKGYIKNNDLHCYNGCCYSYGLPILIVTKKYNLVPTSSPSMIPLYPGSSLHSAFGQLNTVSFKGITYSTIADVSIFTQDSKCQNNLMNLPLGWELALDTPDARLMIASYYWSTDIVILANNIGISTKQIQPSGKVINQFIIRHNGLYMTTYCNSQILIQYVGTHYHIIPTSSSNTTSGLNLELFFNIKYKENYISFIIFDNIVYQGKQLQQLESSGNVYYNVTIINDLVSIGLEEHDSFYWYYSYYTYYTTFIKQYLLHIKRDKDYLIYISFDNYSLVISNQTMYSNSNGYLNLNVRRDLHKIDCQYDINLYDDTSSLGFKSTSDTSWISSNDTWKQHGNIYSNIYIFNKNSFYLNNTIDLIYTLKTYTIILNTNYSNKALIQFISNGTYIYKKLWNWMLTSNNYSLTINDNFIASGNNVNIILTLENNGEISVNAISQAGYIFDCNSLITFQSLSKDYYYMDLSFTFTSNLNNIHSIGSILFTESGLQSNGYVSDNSNGISLSSFNDFLCDLDYQSPNPYTYMIHLKELDLQLEFVNKHGTYGHGQFNVSIPSYYNGFIFYYFDFKYLSSHNTLATSNVNITWLSPNKNWTDDGMIDFDIYMKIRYLLFANSSGMFHYKNNTYNLAIIDYDFNNDLIVFGNSNGTYQFTNTTSMIQMNHYLLQFKKTLLANGKGEVQIDLPHKSNWKEGTFSYQIHSGGLLDIDSSSIVHWNSSRWLKHGSVHMHLDAIRGNNFLFNSTGDFQYGSDYVNVILHGYDINKNIQLEILGSATYHVKSLSDFDITLNQLLLGVEDTEYINANGYVISLVEPSLRGFKIELKANEMVNLFETVNHFGWNFTSDDNQLFQLLTNTSIDDPTANDILYLLNLEADVSLNTTLLEVQSIIKNNDVFLIRILSCLISHDCVFSISLILPIIIDENASNTPSLPDLSPTSRPTIEPSTYPTTSPNQVSAKPTTRYPTILPSNIPTSLPSYQPTILNSSSPTSIPSSLLSYKPTILKSSSPTSIPSTPLPSSQPTILVSNEPSAFPTSYPTTSPADISGLPTSFHTNHPSNIPSNIPTVSPTYISTMFPSSIPTVSPTNVQSENPTTVPSLYPTSCPNLISAFPTVIAPTTIPTSKPSSVNPSAAPSVVPSMSPSTSPSLPPSQSPSVYPSTSPNQVSATPTYLISVTPTITSTYNPSSAPSVFPSTSPNAISAYPTAITSTFNPSNFPTLHPTGYPSTSPDAVSATPTSYKPTAYPSNNPSVMLMASEFYSDITIRNFKASGTLSISSRSKNNVQRYKLPSNIREALINVTAIAGKISPPNYVNCSLYGILNGTSLYISTTTVFGQYSSNSDSVSNAESNMMNAITSNKFKNWLQNTRISEFQGNISISVIFLSQFTVSSPDSASSDNGLSSSGLIAAIVVPLLFVAIVLFVIGYLKSRKSKFYVHSIKVHPVDE